MEDLIFSKQVHILPKGWRRNYRAWDKCSSSPTVEAAAVPNERGDLVLTPSTRPTVKAAIGLYLKIGFYQQRDVCGPLGGEPNRICHCFPDCSTRKRGLVQPCSFRNSVTMLECK
ncbi:hypothetical protein Bbelb_330150 [Branchiostoma belcheri]|nr:hypothetical protein Bbelb_330150 [Branchiostoma belcheri]